jgi:hypothetical protein
MAGDTESSGLRWRKSSFSQTEGCVEWAIAEDESGVFVRHSGDPGGSILQFTHSEWEYFVAGVKRGEADRV